MFLIFNPHIQTWFLCPFENEFKETNMVNMNFNLYIFVKVKIREFFKSMSNVK